MPPISIIVPCYNQAQYLDECLQSVLDQTWQDWECIIVNDGSSDNTQEIAEKWCRKDSRFSYLHKENGGVASARNLGLDHARFDWILPLDGDDRIGKQYLQLAVAKIEEGYDLIYCNGAYFGSREGIIQYGDYSFPELLQYNMIFVSAVFNIKKAQNIRFDISPENSFEDWEFWINYLKNNDRKVIKLQETLFYYRIRGNSRNALTIDDTALTETARKYIYKKYAPVYHIIFGDYLDLLNRLRKVEREAIFYKKAYDSRRYRIGNAIVSLFDRLKK